MVILILTMGDDNIKKLVKLQNHSKNTLSKHIPWEGLAICIIYIVVLLANFITAK